MVNGGDLDDDGDDAIDFEYTIRRKSNWRGHVFC